MENTNIDCFLSIVRAGLWNKTDEKLHLDEDKISAIFRYSQEQSIVGLITAGIEKVKGAKIQQNIALTLVGEVVELEQRNLAMNAQINVLLEKMRTAGICTLLVKGQGVAQCYERPLWRTCGDVDLLFSDTNYLRAKEILTPMAQMIEPEDIYEKHLALIIDGWSVELHGSLRTGLSRKIDRQIDSVQRFVFNEGDVRSWINGNTRVFLPGINSDIFLIFGHILKHFFREGVGLRQICDWCRLIWKYYDEIDVNLLKSRLKKSGLMSEWKAFASLAVNYLGMPGEVMPLYTPSSRWHKKARKIIGIIMKTGSFGHNKDNSYYAKAPFIIRKSISMWRYTKDSFIHFFIFPVDSIKAWLYLLCRGVLLAIKGR